MLLRDVAELRAAQIVFISVPSQVLERAQCFYRLRGESFDELDEISL